MLIQDLDNPMPTASSASMASTDPDTGTNPEAEAETQIQSPPTSTPLCGVCNTNPPRYKCPRCLLPYCSLPCSTTHKQTHANDPPPPPPPAPTQPITAPTALPNTRAGTANHKGPFAGLEDSAELRELFRRYPRLRGRLGEILSATTQRGDDDDNNNAGGYNNNGGRYGKKKEWTPEGGMERGVRALARARGGEDGEGVREFERLVLGRVESDNGEDGDGRQGAWKEEVQESVRVVERLLRGEM